MMRPKTFWTILTLILVVGTLLRFVGLSDRLAIGDDQARDLLTIKRSIEHHHPFVVGPPLSPNVGSIFLGPAYYYLMAPVAYLTHYHPLGITVWTVILSLLMLILFGLLGRLIGNPTLGLIGAAILATSAIVIAYSRFPWNPNPLPLVGTIILISVWAWSVRRPWGFAATLLSLTVATQLHATAVFLIPAILLVWWLARLPRPTLWAGVVGFGGSLVLYGPWFFHEWKHRGAVLRGYLGVVSNTVIGHGLPWHFEHAYDNVFPFFLNEFMSARQSLLFTAVAVILMTYGAIRTWPSAVTKTAASSLFVGVIAYILYDQVLYLHYFFFLITPIVYLLAAGLADLFHRSRAGYASTLVFLAILS